jgi:uncharacterized membrane protein YfcA
MSLKQVIGTASFLVLLTSSMMVFSQPTGGGPTPPDPVPISGIEFLLAAGALIGVRRALSYRKEDNS